MWMGGKSVCHFVSYDMSLEILTSQWSVSLTTAESSGLSSWSANCFSHLVSSAKNKEELKSIEKLYTQGFTGKGILLRTISNLYNRQMDTGRILTSLL